MKKMNFRRMMAGALVLMLMLTCFAGCGEDSNNAVAGATAEDAIAYLKAIYKDDGAQTAVDFERFSIVRISGVPFEVVWTANVDESMVKVTVNDDGTATIDVNEECDAETKYVLTATVKNDKGEAFTHSWNYVIPEGVSFKDIMDAAYALESGKDLGYDVTLTGKVTSIKTAYDPTYDNISVVISVDDRDMLCYRMKGEDLDQILVGDTITVTGLIKNYNGTIEFDSGCTLDAREAGDTVVLTDPKEIVEEAYHLDPGESLPFTATLTGKIVSIDDPYSTQYGNITVSIEIDGCEGMPIKCFRLKGEGAENLQVGDVITVTGIIKNYQHSSGDCEVEFDAGCTFVK